MKRYLVTGGLGVVGSSFAREMLQAGRQVTVVDAAESPRNEFVARQLAAYPNCRVVRGRLERMAPELLRDLVAQHEHVLHAAASTGIPHSARDPNDDWASNVDATKALLEALRRVADDGSFAPPTVMLSSVKPYSTDVMPKGGFDEATPLVPDEPYAASKMAQTALAMAWARTYELPVMAFRCSNLYGAAPCHGPRHGWLTWLCIAAAIGRPFEVQGGGTAVRDMLWSSDITGAVEAALRAMPRLRGEVFNLGGGWPNAVAVRDAVEIVRARVPSLRTTEGPRRAHEDPIFVTNFEKFSRRTGWEPQVSVAEGVNRVVAWASAHVDELRAIYLDQ